MLFQEASCLLSGDCLDDKRPNHFSILFSLFPQTVKPQKTVHNRALWIRNLQFMFLLYCSIKYQRFNKNGNTWKRPLSFVVFLQAANVWKTETFSLALNLNVNFCPILNLPISQLGGHSLDFRLSCLLFPVLSVILVYFRVTWRPISRSQHRNNPCSGAVKNEDHRADALVGFFQASDQSKINCIR